MADNIEEKHVEHTEVRRLESPRPRWGRIIVGIIILLLIGGGIAYAVYKNRHKENNQANLGEIRNAFPSPSQSSSSPNSFFFGGPTPSATPTPTLTPTPTKVAGSNPNRQPAPNAYTPIPPPSIYTSPNGFQFTLPGTWAVDPAQNSANNELFFSRTNGNLIGSAEVYGNGSAETLDSLQEILAGSPDVSRISRTTVGGVEAIRYTARGSENEAVIFGNRIYYFHGALVGANIKFL